MNVYPMSGQFPNMQLFLPIMVSSDGSKRSLCIVFGVVFMLLVDPAACSLSRQRATLVPKKNSEPTAAELRLPTTVVPNDYQLQIKVHLPGYDYNPGNKTETFEGRVKINITVLEDIKSFRLHAFELNLLSITFKESSGMNRLVWAKELPELQMIEVDFLHRVSPGNYFLELTFESKLRTDMNGLYKSTYTENNVLRTIAVTHFEASTARKMVPCFDEPGMKANWTVTVIHPRGTLALSNGIELASWDSEGMIETKFKTTPKMSTYLLAICVADFVKREGKLKSGALVRVWSRRSVYSNTEYALEAAIKTTNYYEKYYDIPFPLEKQDLIAVPDSELGAMENWGMITFKEIYLLYDPAIDTPLAKRQIADTVTHELAHQWFGNLVTMKWWDDVWLNEGFAAFIQNSGADVVSDGGFKMEDSSVSYSQRSAFEDDALSTSHPLSFSIAKVDKVREAFDGITYEKGASILRMFQYVLGEEYFKKGLRYYLKKHAYGNAKVDDLFDALNRTSSDSLLGPDGQRLDVVDFANQWTRQMGFPLLTVTRHNSSHVQISQSRYKNDPNQVDNPKYSHPKYGFKWDVPIWYQEGSDKQEKFVWLPREGPIYVEAKDTIVLNTDSRAFFRVNYEKELLESIADKLHEDVNAYSGRTKYRLLADAFLMAKNEKISYELLLDLVKFLQNEKKLLPWEAAIVGINEIKNAYGNEPAGIPLTKFVKKLIKKSGLKPQWSEINRNYLNDQKYEEVNFGLLLKSFDEDSEELVNAYNKHVVQSCKPKQKSTECSLGIPAPMRQSVFCSAVEKIGDEAIDRIVEFLKVGDQPIEQRTLINALGCGSTVASLEKALNLALDPEGPIRLQDIHMVFEAVTEKPLGREISLQFLLNNYSSIYKKLSATGHLFRRVIRFLTNNIYDEQSLQSLLKLIKENPGAEKITPFIDAIANAKIHIKWTSKYYTKVSDLFKKAADSL